MQHTSWLNALNGEEYGRLWAWGNKPEQKGDYEAASPCVMSDIPQSVLEPILVEEASKLGADFRFYTEFVSFTDRGDGVDTILRDRETGNEYTVRSRYLIGADGARSKVLEQLAIPVVGRQIIAVGGNEKAARLAGVPVHRVKQLVYVISGGLAGIAGLIVIARNAASDANLVGLGMELDAIAAVAVGGTLLTGGKANIFGTIVGAFVIQLMQYTLLANGVPDAAARVIKAALIILAVFIQQRANKA